MEIKIKYFNNSPKLEKIIKGDWIDLHAAEDIDLKAGDFYIMPLGIAMQLPCGYEAYIAPRSSTFKKWGIIQTNSIAVIDESYCGDNDEWKMPIYAMRDTHISKGDRICQFRIMESQPRIEFKTVEILGNKDRGGFGTTGTK